MRIILSPPSTRRCLTAVALSAQIIGLACSANTAPTASSDSWARIVGDGFGSATQNTVPEFETYNGYLYVATAPKDTGLAKLFRSSSGDPGSFSEVTPTLSGDKSIHTFGKTTIDGGFLWCGTGGADGGMVFRTQDGTTWTAIAKRGFGNPALKNVTPHMVVFQGPGDTKPYLYSGMNSHGGGSAAQVWRIPYDDSTPANWVKVHDFDGSSPVIDQVTYFYVFGGKIYFGTNAGAYLYQSVDGLAFTSDAGVPKGFGDNTNAVIASLEEFGGYLYATTNNPTKGGQIWRSSNGTTWASITTDAFGKGPSVFELRSIRAAFNKLWVTGYTDTTISKGTPVWRSDDGVTWIQSNTDGFGDINNNGQNAVVIGFGDYEYFGGPNYAVGGQVWRAKMQ